MRTWALFLLAALAFSALAGHGAERPELPLDYSPVRVYQRRLAWRQVSVGSVGSYLLGTLP